LKKLYILKTIGLVLLLLVFLSISLNAQIIKDIHIKNTNNKLFINARLDIRKNILDEVFELLHNGVNITIIYIINIYQERPFYYIMDTKLKTVKYKKTIKYNMWEKQYYLTDGEVKQKISNRKDINKNIKRIKKVYLTDKTRLKNGKYYLKIKASLESVKLFPPLSWIFGLVTDLGFETPWARKEINE